MSTRIDGGRFPHYIRDGVSWVLRFREKMKLRGCTCENERMNGGAVGWVGFWRCVSSLVRVKTSKVAGEQGRCYKQRRSEDQMPSGITELLNYRKLETKTLGTSEQLESSGNDAREGTRIRRK